MMTVTHDPVTGRPLTEEGEAVETLTDEELEAELTVASYDPVRRSTRYERLIREWLGRQRGYRRHREAQPT